MKPDWHGYEKNLVAAELAIKESKLTSQNKDLLFKFERDLVVQGLTRARILKYMDTLKRVGLWLGKDFDTASKDDIVELISKVEKANYTEWTKQTYKCLVKRFYKWVCKCEDGYPDVVRWIKTDYKKDRSEPLGKSELLNEDDVVKLLSSTTTLRDKALVSILWETGCRIGEIATLRFNNLQFDDHGAVVQVNGKTGARQVRIINSATHLGNWLNTHPSHNKQDGSVFVNLGRVRLHEPMTYQGIRKMLRVLFKSAGVQKPSNPHVFRHSRATFMASYLTEFQMNQYFGWVQGSNMPSTYVHLNGRDLDGALLRMNGMQTEQTQKQSVMQPKSCVKCGMTNSHDNKYCSRCGGILDTNELVKLQEERRQLEEKRHFADGIMNQMLSDPDVQALLKTKMLARSG